MKKIFLIIGMFLILVSTSQASEWSAINNDTFGYNFYVDRVFLGENF